MSSKPAQKASRGVKKDCLIRDFWNFYRKRYKKVKPAGFYERTYFKLIADFNSMLADDLIQGGVFTMPYGLGELCIKKKKSVPFLRDGKLNVKHIPVNWKRTRVFWKEHPEAMKEGRAIRLTNDHTDNYTFKFGWYKPRKKNIRNLEVYNFVAARSKKKKLNRFLMDPDSINSFQIERKRRYDKRKIR